MGQLRVLPCVGAGEILGVLRKDGKVLPDNLSWKTLTIARDLECTQAAVTMGQKRLERTKF